MKTLKEISKTGIPDTKWCSEEDVKKMFDNYTEKLKECVKNYNIPSDPLLKLDIEDDIDKLSKEVMGE